MAFNALLPAYKVDANPFQESFNALGGSIDQLGKTLEKNALAQENRDVNAKLAAGDYKGAMAATRDPSLALNVLGAQRAQAAEGRAQKQFDADWFGNQAMAIANLPNGPQRAAAWASFIAKHPDRASLDAAHIDPVNGPRIVSAEYGKYKDELERKMKLAQLAHMGTQDQVARAQLGQLKMQTPEYRAGVAGNYGLQPGTPEYNSFVLNGTYTPRDPMEQFIQGQIRSSLSPQAPQQQGGVQPQSFDGPPITPPPGIVLTGSGDQPKPTGTTAGSTFQNMPPDQKRALAEAMLLNPKYKAMGEQLIKDLEQGNLGKEGRNEVDKKALATGEGLARLMAVKGGFKPEYLTIENRLGYAWNAAKEKYLGGRATLSPQQKAELEAFTGFKADAIDNLNQYIKDITGAAMTDSEAKRIMAGMPNVGSGLFDGDSPTEFKSKLDAAVNRLKVAHARWTFAQKTGKPWTSIGLHEMGGIIQKRTDELQGLYQQQGLRGEDLKNAVTKTLKQDFGI